MDDKQVAATVPLSFIPEAFTASRGFVFYTAIPLRTVCALDERQQAALLALFSSQAPDPKAWHLGSALIRARIKAGQQRRQLARHA